MFSPDNFPSIEVVDVIGDSQFESVPAPTILIPPSKEVDEYFRSDLGAELITTIGQIESAMSEVYYYRAENSLEFPAIQDIPFFPEYESCTKATRDAAFEL